MKPNTVPAFLFVFLTYFASTVGVEAVIPAPDGCYPNFTTAEGCNVLQSLMTGIGNTGVGSYSLFGNTTGGYNTAVGAGALDLNNGDNNTATGVAALLLNSTGNNNTANGVNALASNNTGSRNTANGGFALYNNTLGSGNIAIGYLAGSALTGNNNIDIGNLGVVDESSTIRLGDPAIHEKIFIAGIVEMSSVPPNRAVLLDPATGQLGSADVSSFGVVITETGNTAVGDQALSANAANYNTATGYLSLTNNTLGARNTAYGAQAMESNTGNASGFGSFNDAFGAFALNANESGFSNNAFGDSALLGNISAAANTAIGDLALMNNDVTGKGQANYNTAVGAQALSSNTDGDSNNAVGFNALGDNTTGVYNQAFGAFALTNNTSGSHNIAIGDTAGDSVTTANNVISIGDSIAGENVSNSCYIGNISGQPGGAQAVYVNGNGKLGFQVSSRRFKDDIKPIENASEIIYHLKPVTFRYKAEIEPSRPLGFGLIAEDVEQTSPDLVTRDVDGRVGSVRYDAVNAMLLNEFLKEHEAFVEQQHKVKEQGATITRLEHQIEALTVGLQKVSAQLELNKFAQQTVLNNE